MGREDDEGSKVLAPLSPRSEGGGALGAALGVCLPWRDSRPNASELRSRDQLGALVISRLNVPVSHPIGTSGRGAHSSNNGHSSEPEEGDADDEQVVRSS